MARTALLARRTIDSREAVKWATTHLEPEPRATVRAAANRVVEARNAAVHLGDVEVSVGDLADAFVVAMNALWDLAPAGSSARWGLYREVARVGVLGRRDDWVQDKAIRLAQAHEQLHTMATTFSRRSLIPGVEELQEVPCPVCKGRAFLNPATHQPSPAYIPRSAPDSTVAVLDCLTCGLTLWGPQIP